jgi:translation elongation factor EF-4
MMSSASAYFTPKMVNVDELGPGEIGFFTGSIKEVADTRVGDTITDDRKPTAKRCRASSRRSRWCSAACSRSMPPTSRSARRHGQAAPQRRVFSFEMETSAALGFGFRCGFLGLLHLEIIQERLEREFDLDLIATAPSVVYKMHLTDGEEIELHNPDRHAGRGEDRRDPGAVDRSHDPDARRISRQRAEALSGPPRQSDRTDLCRQARHGEPTSCRSTKWCSISTTA